MKARASALYVRQAAASSASRAWASPSAVSGILASPASSAPPTTRIRGEPYELTATAASAPPPISPPSIGSVPSGKRIRAQETPTSAAIAHQDRGAVRRSSYDCMAPAWHGGAGPLRARVGSALVSGTDEPR